MNPYYLISAAIGALLHLRRICPKCKETQVVPASKKREEVCCKFCGAGIPAPR